MSCAYCRWLVAEAYGLSDDDRHNYYRAGSTPFFFDLVDMHKICKTIDATCVRQIIRKGTNLAEGEWPNFVVGM